MKNAIKLSVLSYLLIILLLAVSGSVGGIAGRVIYFSAFVLPLLLLLPIAKKSELPLYPVSFKIDARGMCYTALTLFPFILCVMAISFLMALLLNALGYNSENELEGALVSVILMHAVLPALCEELVFRYLPIRLIAPHSPRCAVVLSSVAFALTHCNLYQIPYALFAGLVLSAITVISGSIWPPIILHFFNNLASILLQRMEKSCNAPLIFVIVIAVLTLISLSIAFLMRRRIACDLAVITKDECKVLFTPDFLLFSAACIILTGLELVL